MRNALFSLTTLAGVALASAAILGSTAQAAPARAMFPVVDTQVPVQTVQYDEESRHRAWRRHEEERRRHEEWRRAHEYRHGW